MQKQSSSEAAWSLLSGAVSDARVEAHRLRHLVNRGLKIVDGLDKAQKESVYQLAGDLVDAVPSRLTKLENLLNKTSYALTMMGEDFFSSRLSLEDKTEVKEAVEHSSHPFSRAIRESTPASRVAARYLRRADLMPPLGRPGGPCHVVKRIDENVLSPKVKETLIDNVEAGQDLSNPAAQAVYKLTIDKAGGGWKQMLITPHAQYRMDLRGVSVAQVQKSLSNLWTQMSRDVRLKADVEYSDRYQWDDRQLRLTVVLDAEGSAVKIVTAYPTGASDPKPPEGGCDL